MGVVLSPCKNTLFFLLYAVGAQHLDFRLLRPAAASSTYLTVIFHFALAAPAFVSDVTVIVLTQAVGLH